ncbi:MAG: hypothetical protein V2I56_02825 [Desulfobacteraceae bacterium]|jgi:hypothetical protein|nr:hypothetical protein [Desulfobacteraceae bacterium]
MKKSKKQKPHKRRAKKQKHAKASQQGIPKMLRRDPALRKALNYRHPLVACRINKDWQEHGMALVIVARGAPTGIVYSGFLLDLLGLGLKDAMGDYGVSEYELGEFEFLDGVHGTDLIACDYDLAADLVYGGLAWARKWHFRLPKDYKVWMRLLDPPKNDDIDLQHFGHNGKPLLIGGPEDLDIYLNDDFDPGILKNQICVEKSGLSEETLNRLGDIKGALITYSRGEKFSDDFNAELRKKYGKQHRPENETDWINFQDWFTLEWKTDGGDGVIDQFVRKYKNDMSPDILTLIRGWKRVLQGIFDIKERAGNGLLVKNLINEKEYRVYSANTETSLMDFNIGDFILGRIVPALDYHVFSGALAVFPTSDNRSLRADMYREAARIQTQNSRQALMDNPEKLQKSREAVQRQYDDFMDCFGNDEVLGTGKEIHKHYRYFFQYQMFEKQDEETGLTKAEEYKSSTGRSLKPLKIDLPREIRSSKDVAMLCDPSESISFLMEYGKFLDIFKYPEKYLGRTDAEDIVMGYLESDTISDVPFRRMAERYSENFDTVLAYYKNQQLFSANNLEELMKEFKPWSYDKLPGIVAILDEKVASYARQHK